MEQYSITIVPISLMIDGQVCRDGVDISPREVYELVAANKSIPTTSSPTPGDFVAAYRKLSEWAKGTICVTICSDTSMMFDSAMEARQIGPEITVNVVDSRTAGGARGFVALAAARAAMARRELAAVTAEAEAMIPGVNMIAVLDTLEHVARAGRIPKAAAWAGSVLKISPILTFAHDGIGLMERARTKFRAARRPLDIMDERTKGRTVHVDVMHANVPGEAGALRSRIEKSFDCRELFVTDFAPTMGVQAGPGVLGLAFYSEEESDVG